MNDSPTILLTGFTGILGKRFAYRLAAKGYNVLCPIRAGSEKEALERFQSIFHALSGLLPEFDPSLERRIRPVPGDVRKKNLGIPASIVEEVSGMKIQGIWHLAALLDLTETKSQDVYDTNFLGTLNVMEFAREMKIPELHYFSTFGSSGKLHEGIVREIPGIKPPSFRNTYERTKWETERRVWQAQIRGEILATIYRPSIVVGDSILGRYEQFNVFNHPFDIVSRVRKKLMAKAGQDPRTATLNFDLRIPGNGNATLNIVPLDFVLDTVMKIFEVASSRGRVYHIVNPNPPALDLAMEIFKRNEPWDGLKWGAITAENPFLNPYEKFVAKQLAFLAPYLMGEAIYDYSNVQAVLGLHGGMPAIKNDVFLNVISRRGIEHGWQEVKESDIAAMISRREQLDTSFVWPESTGLVVDFTPHHPVGEGPAPTTTYSMTERLLGKAYQFRERLFSRRATPAAPASASARDIVLVPFGMGVTRRGEAENLFYHQHESLVDQVYAHMNQAVGFDLRAYAQRSIPRHEEFGHIHDNCCYAVADDLVHIMRLFRDIQRTGGRDLVRRMMILPHSAGTYLAGWLSGVVSFQDAALITHQCSHLMAECESLLSLDEVEKWFFNQKSKLSEAELHLLQEIRKNLDPQLTMSREALAGKLHGRLELVFSLNAGVLQRLVEDIKENHINVSHAITMSTNTGVFAGNELEMTRFRSLFVGKRKIELRRVPLEVNGTPHYARLKDAGKQAAEVLKLYDRQGRLRDPVLPVVSYNGQLVRTKEQFIQAVAGIADQTCYWDRMIERMLEEGGRHFILIQSGMASAAGDLFEGVIRKNANMKGHPSVQIYPPSVRPTDTHPLCNLLDSRKEDAVPEALNQSMSETIRWYENQLTAS